MTIELKNASFQYPNGFLANDNLTLTIEKGEKVAIIGQNGAGKTTCVKMMNGLYKPFSGDVLVDGINTKDKTTAQIAPMVGYVFQNPDDQIFNQSVIKEVEYMLVRTEVHEKELRERVDDALKLTKLDNAKNMNPYDMPLPIRKFLTIAAIIATNPDYYIFDEPTAGQDVRGNHLLEEIIDTLNERGKTVIIISHDMEFVAKNFRRVVVMANKEIIADGEANEIFLDNDILEKAAIKKTEATLIAEALGLKEKVLNIDELVDALLEGGMS